MTAGKYKDSELEKLVLYETAINSSNNIVEIDKKIPKLKKIDFKLRLYDIDLELIQNIQGKESLKKSIAKFNMSESSVLSSLIRFNYGSIDETVKQTGINKPELINSLKFFRIDIEQSKKQRLNYLLIRYKGDETKVAKKINIPLITINKDINEFNLKNIDYDDLYSQCAKRIKHLNQEIEIIGSPMKLNYAELKSLPTEILFDYIGENPRKSNPQIESHFNLNVKTLTSKLTQLKTNTRKIRSEYNNEIYVKQIKNPSKVRYSLNKNPLFIVGTYNKIKYVHINIDSEIDIENGLGKNGYRPISELKKEIEKSKQAIHQHINYRSHNLTPENKTKTAKTLFSEAAYEYFLKFYDVK